jgi:hypothetical protein
MNNPLRAAVQRRVETRWLLDLGGPLHGGVALEVGCGRGVEIILDRFQAGRVDGFDLDPHSERSVGCSSRRAGYTPRRSLARFILNPVVRRLLRHPLEDRFDAARFCGALEVEGFRVVDQRSLGPWFAWFVADKAVRG